MTTTMTRDKHGQIHVDSETGDCFRASMSYLLGVPNSPDLPNDHSEPGRFLGWQEWLRPFGLELEWDAKRIWREGLWILSVQSKNMPGKTHAIVMRGNRVEFDPSPHRRYRRGRRLLGDKAVVGGYYLVVSDPRALWRLVSGQRP